jgi:hypothetical protein
MTISGDAWNDQWRGLYRVGSVSAWIVLLLMPVQVAVYVLWPPPETTTAHFLVFRDNVLIGLLGFDLLYMVSIILSSLVMLTISIALWSKARSAITVALFVGTISVAIYFASSVALEMSSVSNLYARASSPEEQRSLVAVGDALVARYKGTAFAVSYMLTAVSGLIIAWVMVRTGEFGRTIALLGLAMNAMAIVPANAGQVGLVLSFASLLPTIIWLGLVAVKLGRMASAPIGIATLG